MRLPPLTAYALQRTQVICPAAHHMTENLKGQILRSVGLPHTPGQEGVRSIPPTHRPCKRKRTLTQPAPETLLRQAAAAPPGARGAIESHRMYSLISFSKSTPSQNYELIFSLLPFKTSVKLTVLWERLSETN